MIEKRIRDGRVLQRIRKWIPVGVIDEGKFLVSETGTGKDKRLVRSLPTFTCTTYSTKFEEAVKLRSEAHEIRFADDAILCFHYREDAEKVKSVISKRFAKYGLTLHPEKTRLMEFGRYAEERAMRRGRNPAPSTFSVLVCCRSTRIRSSP